jgi:hypothetical protein
MSGRGFQENIGWRENSISRIDVMYIASNDGC